MGRKHDARRHQLCALPQHECGAEPDQLQERDARVDAGTNTTATVHNLVPAQYAFVVTAQKDGLESDPRNTVNADMLASPSRTRTVLFPSSLLITNLSFTVTFP